MIAACMMPVIVAIKANHLTPRLPTSMARSKAVARTSTSGAFGSLPWGGGAFSCGYSSPRQTTAGYRASCYL